MKSHSMGFKLAITFSFLIVFFMCLGVFELNRTARINEVLQATLERRWNKVQQARDSLGYTNVNNRITLGIFLLNSNQEIKEFQNRRVEYAEKITGLLKALKTQADSSREKELLAAIEHARAPYIASYMASLDLLINKHKSAAARNSMIEVTVPLLITYGDRWNDFVNFEGLEMGRATEKNKRDYLAERRRLLFLLVLAGIVGVSGALYVTQSEIKMTTSRDQLQEQIVGLNTQLEQKVAHRTTELARANLELVAEIGERERLEAELFAAHVEAEQLLSSISSIMIGVDDKGRVTRWNAAAAATFVIPSEVALNCPFDDLAIPWRKPGVGEKMASAAVLGKSRRFDDLEFSDAAGQVRSLGATIHPIRSDQGQYRGFVFLGVETSQRRQLQEQLRQAQKLEAIGQLAAGVAHEINTPTQYVGDNLRFLQESWGKVNPLLNLIGRLCQDAEGTALSPELAAELNAGLAEAEIDFLVVEVPKALAQSLDGVERVSQIVKAMREFSHRGSIEKLSADLNRAIEAAITVSRNEWKYVADVKTDLDPELPLLHCVIGQIQQVILNLLINAAHAIEEKIGPDSQQKGVIHVTTRSVSDAVEIRVEDTGNGIPEELRSRVFEPFFTTKPVGKGTGHGVISGALRYRQRTFRKDLD